MEIYFERENKTIELDFEGNINEILNKYNLIEDEIVIIKNDEVVTSEEKITQNDKLKILNVVSGG